MSWLVTIAIREAIKLARRDQRELSLEAQVDDDGEPNIASPDPAPHELAEWRERLELMRRLPTRQRRFSGCSPLATATRRSPAERRG